MSTISTVGISFGADAIVPVALSARQKTDAMTRLEEARLKSLDPRVQEWSDKIDLPDLECMDQIARAYRAEGYAPVRVHLPDLARKMECSEADAEARVERLVRSGAVERIRKIAAAPTFRPCTRGPVTASKAERDIAAVRDMAEDALRAINGQGPVQRAKAETSMFPAGTMLGLHRRN